MAYVIKITVRNVEDPQSVAQFIASMLERSTGQSVKVIVNDKKADMQLKASTKNNTYTKLLR